MIGSRIEIPRHKATRSQMREHHEAGIAEIFERMEKREGETSEQYCRRLFEQRKAAALSESSLLTDFPDPLPDEAPAIAALRSELARLRRVHREKVNATFDAEEAFERARDEQEAAHTAACKAAGQLLALLDNCEIIVWRKNGRGRKRSFVEVLPHRGTTYGLSRVVQDLNAKYASEGSNLVADLHERPYPPGIEEPADEPEPAPAFEETRELACA